MPADFEVNDKSGCLVISGVFGVAKATRVGYAQGL
jgi:hypothetical protein